MLRYKHPKCLNWLVTQYGRQLQKCLAATVKTTFITNNFLILKTTGNQLGNVFAFVKAHSLSRYLQLIELAVEDAPTQTNRFRVCYIFSSFVQTHKLIIACSANELTNLPSITAKFASAGWLEREVWDLFGIYFCNNLDLRRILTDYGFSAHPLRKDFPLTGFSEIYYSVDKKRIITAQVELAQEYRVFTY